MLVLGRGIKETLYRATKKENTHRVTEI